MKSALCLSFSFALFAIPTAHAAHLAGNAVDWTGRQVSPTVTSRVFRQVCVNNNGEVAYVGTVATSTNQANVLWSTGGLGRTGTPAGTYEVQTPAFPAVPGTVGVAGLDHFYLNNNGTLSVTGRSVLSGKPYFISIGSTEVLRAESPGSNPTFPAQMTPRSPDPSKAAALTDFSTSSFNCAFAEGTVVASITTDGDNILMYRSLSGSNWVRPGVARDMMTFVAAGKNGAFLGLIGDGDIGSKSVSFGQGLDVVRSPRPNTGAYIRGVVSSGVNGNAALVAGAGPSATLFKCTASGSMVTLASPGKLINGTSEGMMPSAGFSFGRMAMDRIGFLVYVAATAPSGSRGIFRSPKGASESFLLLKTGASAPGVSNYRVDSFEGMALAESGRLLVHAKLKYNGNPPANVPALKEVLYDTTNNFGALRLFAEAGDTVTVDGQTKTITGFELGNVVNNAVSISGLPINDSGMVACTLKFGNDRAVFVFDAK